MSLHYFAVKSVHPVSVKENYAKLLVGKAHTDYVGQFDYHYFGSCFTTNGKTFFCSMTITDSKLEYPPVLKVKTLYSKAEAYEYIMAFERLFDVKERSVLIIDNVAYDELKDKSIKWVRNEL
jgi:hypothetical protein